MKVVFITVNYCQAELTINLLENLSRISGTKDIKVIVVDNSNDKDDVKKIQDYKNRDKTLSLDILKAPSNMGYFGAVNFALKSLSHLYDFDFLIVSNNDIEIRDEAFFENLRALMGGPEIIAPDIVSTVTGKHQNPHRLNKITKNQKLQYRLLFTNYYFGLTLYLGRKLVKKMLFHDAKMNKPGKMFIYSAHGAFIVFSKAYFEKGGTIDDGYFLYGEEDSIAAQCEKSGMKILMTPELQVYHNEHVSTDGSGFKRKIYLLQKKAYKYIKANYPNFY